MSLARIAFLFTLSVYLNSVYAADSQRGKELHDTYCLSCHTSIMGGDPYAIFTRDNSRIGSYEDLQRQVTQCKERLDVGWPQENVDDVVEYLNQKFYQFPR